MRAAAKTAPKMQQQPGVPTENEKAVRRADSVLAIRLFNQLTQSTLSWQIFSGSLIADFPPAFLKFDTYETIHMNDSRRANHSDRYLVLYLDGG